MSSDLRPGAEPVAGYRLIERLGRGGFGEVWKAAGPGGFLVALKFVVLAADVGPVELRALQVIRDIRHPHLLATFGSWQLDGRLIIAMELAERTLLDRLREAAGQGMEGIPAPEVHEHFLDAARGLDYLNEPRHPAGGSEPQGIQHRDVKPQNLLLIGGSVKVADFGLARVLEHTQTNHTGSMTPSYAPPEFFEKKTSSQSDQYSLAVTYCHMRGGRLPFTGNIAAVMAGHMLREPDLSMLPEAERPAVARAMAKDPHDRWPSCRAFVKAVISQGELYPHSVPLTRHPERPETPPPLPIAPERNTSPDPEDSLAAFARSENAAGSRGVPVRGRAGGRPRSRIRWIMPAVVICALPIGGWYVAKRGWFEVENGQARKLGDPLDQLPRPAPTDQKQPAEDKKAGLTPEQEEQISQRKMRDAKGLVKTSPKPATQPRPAEPDPKEAPYEKKAGHAAIPLKGGEQAKAKAGKAFSEPSKLSESQAIVTRGLELMERYRFAESLLRFEEALKTLPNDARAHAGRSIALGYDGDRVEARLEADRAIALDPRLPLAHASRAYVLADDHEYDPALAAANEAIRLDPRSSFLRVIRGDVHLSRDEIAQGLADFTAASELDPKSAGPLADRGVAFFIQRSFDQAIADLERAIALDPELVQSHVNLAEVLIYRGELEMAADEISEALKLDPRSYHAYKTRSYLKATEKSFDDALTDADRAISLNGKHSWLYLNRAGIWFERGDLDRALGDVSEALRIDPKDEHVFLTRGDIKLTQKAFDQAMEDFDRAIQLAPRSAECRSHRGNAWFAKGEFDKAIADFTAAIELGFPTFGDPLFYVSRGTAYSQQQKSKLALADFERALTLDSRCDAAYIGRGYARLYANAIDEALADFNKALKINPRSDQAYIGRGTVWLEKSQYTQAIDDLDNAIRLNPHNEAAYSTRGMVRYRTKSFDAALEDLDRALELEPTDALAWNTRGNVRDNKGEYKKAIEDYDQAIKLNPRFVFALANRGTTRNRLLDYEKAIPDFSEAIRIDPSMTQAYLHRSFSYFSLNRLDDALTDLNTAINLTPNDPVLYDARAQVHARKFNYAEVTADTNRAASLRAGQANAPPPPPPAPK
jgi:tetratricopeptide (TPR) repeat protein/serine/threonine protein kinase